MAHLVLLLLTTVSLAQGREGSVIWKSYCVSCHVAEGKGPEAASHFAGLQWQRFLKTNRHDGFVRLRLTNEEREALLIYLKAHAADSDSPEVAGIR